MGDGKVPATTANLSGVVINEIGFDPSGVSQDLNGDGVGNSSDEFIELYNNSGSPVDISGWEIWESGVLRHTVPGGTTIPAGGYYVSVDSAAGTTNPIQNVNGSDADYSDSAYGLADNDYIFLYDPNNNEFVVFAGDTALPASITAGIGLLTSAHPGATQVGPTEDGVASSAGNSVGRDTDGDTTWLNSTPTIGDVNCFAAGTLITTPDGECAVEGLKIGDRVLIADGTAVHVKWIGRQTVSTRFGPAERLMPVRFAAGSLGDGLPHADLTVTADHGMLVDGVICHAGALVNGTTIRCVPLSEMGETYTVYHIETEEHEIILANGAPAETFIDNVSRRAFDNFAEFEALYGDVPEMEELPYPRAMSARQVPGRIVAKLAGKAVA